MGSVVLGGEGAEAGLPFPRGALQRGGRSLQGQGEAGPLGGRMAVLGERASLCQAGTGTAGEGPAGGSAARLVERLPCRLQSGGLAWLGLASSLHRFPPSSPGAFGAGPGASSFQEWVRVRV